jgi:NADH:ubiquinone oxidoreductase subunit D
MEFDIPSARTAIAMTAIMVRIEEVRQSRAS